MISCDRYFARARTIGYWTWVRAAKCFCNIRWRTFYPYPERIVAGGYEAREVVAARQHYPQPQYVQFDGCALPFPDQSFDLVFSNAVIEHILGPGKQEKFAQEVMRLGKEAGL